MRHRHLDPRSIIFSFSDVRLIAFSTYSVYSYSVGRRFVAPQVREGPFVTAQVKDVVIAALVAFGYKARTFS